MYKNALQLNTDVKERTNEEGLKNHRKGGGKEREREREKWKHKGLHATEVQKNQQQQQQKNIEKQNKKTTTTAKTKQGRTERGILYLEYLWGRRVRCANSSSLPPDHESQNLNEYLDSVFFFPVLASSSFFLLFFGGVGG